jgi:glucose/arabinose dehydrogenase
MASGPFPSARTPSCPDSRDCRRLTRRSPLGEEILSKLGPTFVLACLVVACRGFAQTAPEIALETVVTGLPQPTAIVHAGDARLFLTLQRGQIAVFQDGTVLPTAFLDIRLLVSCCGERGLLGLAFHPRYSESGFFFVDYTNLSGDTVIARYRVSAGNPNIADPSSGVTLLTIAQPFSNHNGGQLAFGPDGYLYIGLGDGGSGGDPHGNGQSLSTLLGKMLRIDPRPSGGRPYAIPPDNPFVDRSGARPEIWAYGLRNPWRYSFDRETGDLWIGDVGQGEWEEVDLQPAGSPGGENYGWNRMEGDHSYDGADPPADAVPPVFEYSHDDGGCTVAGGYVYRGESIPDLYGAYVFADYCLGRLEALRLRDGKVIGHRSLGPVVPGLSSFGEDAQGELYAMSLGGGLYRLAQGS